MRSFLGLDILGIGRSKDLDTEKKIKNLDTPNKTSRYQLKESPLLGHLLQMASKPSFDPLLGQINCLAIWALRDLRPIIKQT